MLSTLSIQNNSLVPKNPVCDILMYFKATKIVAYFLFSWCNQKWEHANLQDHESIKTRLLHVIRSNDLRKRTQSSHQKKATPRGFYQFFLTGPCSITASPKNSRIHCRVFFLDFSSLATQKKLTTNNIRNHPVGIQTPQSAIRYQVGDVFTDAQM